MYNIDILVTKINKDGSLAWMKKLPKRQKGNAPTGGMSFTFVEGEKDFYRSANLRSSNLNFSNLLLSAVPQGRR